MAGCEGQDLADAVAGALAAWGRLPTTYPYPLQWLVRAPLAKHLAEHGKAADALEQWEMLLAPSQARLPEALQSSIELALAKRSRDGASDTASLIAISELAREHRYL